jgi:hypothetical protein
MSRRLQRRVAGLGGSQAAAQAGYTPVTGGAASPAAVGTMPQAQVIVYPHPGAGYSSIAYRGLSPIYTADGAAVPASSPGRWAQLIAAGRP